MNEYDLSSLGRRAARCRAKDVVVNRPFPVEGHPEDRRCHEKYPMSCNAQWRRLEVCMEQLESIESSRGAKVDWVLRLRPDMLFPVALGDIRLFDMRKLHLPVGSWTDAHETRRAPKRYVHGVGPRVS